MLRPQGMPQQVNIDPNTLDDIVCKAGAMTPVGQCGNQYFKQVFRMKKVSALVSPSGQEEVITMPVFVCTKCGTELEELKQGGLGGIHVSTITQTHKERTRKAGGVG